MFILRILLKTALLPVVLILLFVKVIYTITKQAWSQTFLLALIEAGIMGITIGTAVIESLIDAALMGIAGI